MNKLKIHIFIITIVFTIFSIFLFGKTGNMLIDFSREIYIPYQLLKGEILSKDIFQIYGFWGYFINQLLYKIILSPKILILEAHILSYLTAIGFYLILINYVKKNYALIFTLFFISINIFSNSIFSFVIPYSYAMIWAVFASVYMLYFTLKNKLNIAFLFLGLIFVNRIELFVLFLIWLLIYFLTKKINFIKSLPFLFIFPAINILYLYLNNVTVNDILNNLNLIKIMSNTEAIKYLYGLTGAFFSKIGFIYCLKETLILLIMFFIGYLLFKKNHKIACYAFLAISLFLFNQNGELFCLNSLMLIILTIINIKKLNSKTLLIIGFSLILSSKALFNSSFFGYGNFGYIFVLFSIFLICKKYISTKYLINFLIIFLIIQNIFNFIYFKINPKYKTKTNWVYLTKEFRDIFDKTNEFINNNIPKNQNFIVIPEGQIFNLIHKKPWGFYNSTFTPLDFETFKEENLIKKLKSNKTPYIIFFPRNTSDYGKAPICYNYGVDFCTYVMDNYTRITILDSNNYKVLIFKRNEK